MVVHLSQESQSGRNLEILSEGIQKVHLNPENVPWREVCVPYRLQDLGNFRRRPVCCHLRISSLTLTILNKVHPVINADKLNNEHTFAHLL